MERERELRERSRLNQGIGEERVKRKEKRKSRGIPSILYFEHCLKDIF